MTEKLYYDNSYIFDFEANIVSVEPFQKDSYKILLDKSFFYPTSGGQPNDIGFFDDIEVIDVFEENEKIYHVTKEEMRPSKINAKIDFERRWDNMQSHSGQHLLSQSFLEILSAPTTSFRIGSEFSTIDLNLEDLTQEQANKVEDFANSIIYENRKIESFYVDENGVEELNLRKKPSKKNKGTIRIIEIEDFDMSPCGGTHTRSTGEIGLIKIKRWEKYKGNVRIEFICGKRALLDYRQKSLILANISNKFSAKETDTERIINKVADENNINQKQVIQLKRKFSEIKAKELLNIAEEYKNFKLVTDIIEDADISLLKQIGDYLIKENNVISILVSEYNKRTNFVFSASENIDINFNKYTKILLPSINGKGGGKPNLVQGSGDITDLNVFIENIKTEILKDLIAKPKEKGNLLNFVFNDNYKEGYTNITTDPNIKADLITDITKLDFKDNSCLEIIAHSCLEKLSYEDSFLFLEECHRVLEIGGTLDIDVLDFEEYSKKWLELPHEQRWEFQNYSIFWGKQLTPHQFNKSGWGKQILSDVLSIFGFKNFRKIPSLNNTLKNYPLIRILAEKVELSKEKISQNIFYRGAERQKRFNFAKSIEDFKQSLRLNPNLLEVYTYLISLVLTEFITYEEIFEFIDELSKENPNLYGPIFGKAVVRLKEGKVDLAYELCEDLIKKDPNNIYTNSLREELYEMRKILENTLKG